MLIRQAVAILNASAKTVGIPPSKMDETASVLPEHLVVMAMNDVNPTLGPQFMAKIEDVPVSHTVVHLPPLLVLPRQE